MALTLTYPTMSAAFAPTGALTIDQFTPTTVHGDSAHNNPHAKLLANDVQIAAYVNALESAAVSVKHTTAISVSAPYTTPSYVDYVTCPIVKSSSSSVLLVIGKCIMSGSAEAFTTSSYWTILAVDGAQVGYSETAFSHYGGTLNNFAESPVTTAIIAGPAGLMTLSLQIKYSGYAAAQASRGSLLVFEFSNVTPL